jgi:sporulation protein YlmC with PRC-barrel domain
VGCLLGLEHQVMANGYTIGWSAIKSIGSLIIIAVVKPDLVLFYL